MASIGVTVESEINAAPEAMFAVLTDPKRLPEWANGMQSGGWTPGSVAAPGGRFEVLYRYGKNTYLITMEVTAIEQNSLLEYQTVQGPYPIEVRFTLSPTPAGTNMSYTQHAISDSKLAAFGFHLTGWFAKPMVRRMLRKDLVKLDNATNAGGQSP